MRNMISQQLQVNNSNMKMKHLFLFAFLIFVCTSILYLQHIWNSSIAETRQDSIRLAKAAESGISKSNILLLNADNSDLNNSVYHELKGSLTAFANQDKSFRFAYILAQKKDSIVILADSEPIDSKDYSPPGQIFSEASKEDRTAFQSDRPLLTNPTKDRWGEWVSVLVPMKDPETGAVVAVYGIDYSIESWYEHALVQTIQSGISVLCLFLVIIALYFYFSRNKALLIEKQKLLDSEKKLKESETLFRTVFDQATIGIAVGHDADCITMLPDNMPSVNPMYEKILGRTKEELTQVSWMDLTHPDDLTLDLEYYNKFKAGEIDRYDMEKRYVRPDGTTVWTHMILSPLQLENNSKYNHICLITDISKRKEIEQVLYDSQRSKMVLLDNLPGMAYRCKPDREWTMEFVSQGCYALTGYPPESLIQNKEICFNQLILEKYQDLLWFRWEYILNQRGKLTEEYEIVTASGEIKWVWEQGQGIFDDAGNIVALEGLILDITERKTQELKLNYMNNHDALTGLYNRRYFEELMRRDETLHVKKAVLLVNLAKFTLINQTFGYNFGEKLMQELASNLLTLCTVNCRLFLISSDRYAFYIKAYQNKKELTTLCNSVNEILSTIPALKTIGASIGIVEMEDCKGDDLDVVLKNALIAAENVQDNKISGYRFFNKKMEEAIMREAEIKNGLSAVALNADDHGFFMEYQPIVDTQSNKIVGFEALARFETEHLGRISPLEFIPLAEETQLIVPLGKKIMRLVLQFLKKLEETGFTEIYMSFNVSTIQLLRDDFIEELVETIRETKVLSTNLGIEITESLFLNSYQEINQKLERLKRLGIKIAIDDFGTGYSSLARERELNVDCLKIDKYFMDKLMKLEPDQALTGDIISMAHKLGHFVVAEGVENERQRQYLIQHHCDLIQGYLFSKPLSEDDAMAILEKEKSTNKKIS